MAIPLFALALPVLILLTLGAIVLAIVWLVMRAFGRSGMSSQEREEQARSVQELNETAERLTSRLESLETILLDQAEPDRSRAATQPARQSESD